MRILHLIQELGIGGAENMTASLIAGARDVGHQVAVAAADGPLVAELDVPIFHLPIIRRRLQRLPGAARAVQRALRAWSPDIVHCHNPGMALALAAATGRRYCRRAVVTIEGLDEHDYRRAGWLIRWLGMPAVACAPGVAASLRDRGLTVRTIVNGVSRPPPSASRTQLESEWPRLRGRRLVVAAGRLVSGKNFTLAIRALAEIPNAALLILGDGPARDQLRRDAADAGVADRVVLPGFRRDVREIIGAADVFVILSRSEGLPIVALEALVAGRPLVAVRANWQQAVLVAERDCLLVDSDVPADLATAIRRVLDDDLLAARLSRAATHLAGGYSDAATVDQYLRLYATLVSA